MLTAQAVVAATTCIWLGMVLAISFMEAPLKFRAPGITRKLGVGIGRLVFGALNKVEMLLSMVVIIALTTWPDIPGPQVTVCTLPIAALAAQILGVRPLLRRQSDRFIAGEQSSADGKRLHIAYVVLECVKVMALTASAWTVFTR